MGLPNHGSKCLLNLSTYMSSLFSLISLSSTSSELLHERAWCRGVKSLCKNMIMIMMRWKQSRALSPPPRHPPLERLNFGIGILRQASKLYPNCIQIVQMNVEGLKWSSKCENTSRLILQGNGYRSMYINVKVRELYPPPVAGSLMNLAQSDLGWLEHMINTRNDAWNKCAWCC